MSGLRVLLQVRVLVLRARARESPFRVAASAFGASSLVRAVRVQSNVAGGKAKGQREIIVLPDINALHVCMG